MANLKISGLNTETNLLNVLGLAGYNASGTIKISGTDLRNSLLEPTSGNVQIRPQAGTLVLGLQGQGIDINGNTQINGSLNLNIDSNTYGAIGTSSFTSISFDGTAASTSTGYAVRLSGPVADSSNAVGTSGQVLSSTGSGTQWINAGGSTPTLQDVVNASAPLPLINDQGTNTSWIEFRQGNTTDRLTIGRDGGTGPFGIVCSQGNFRIQSATFQTLSIQTGTSSARGIIFQYPTSGNSQASFQAQFDLRLSSTSALKCGSSGTAGTAGQVLTSTGTSVEWDDVDAAKAFVTLPAGANASWTVKDNYNASWNIGAGSVTLSITASSGDSGTLVVTTTTGSITWPANSNWPDATEPTLTANGTDIFSFLYDGTNYYWTFGQNFGV
jgi:hypothetical protein